MQWVSTFRLPQRCLFQVTCCAQTETWACAAPDKVSIRIMHQPQCVTHLCRVDSRSRNISTPQQTHLCSHNYSWFYSEASQKWHAEEWGSLNTHTHDWLCEVQCNCYHWTESLHHVWNANSFTVYVRMCVLLSLQLACSSVCIWRKCWSRNSVMSRWGTKTWETCGLFLKLQNFPVRVCMFVFRGGWQLCF